jgi:uncharacterized phage protein gp47/JayE
MVTQNTITASGITIEQYTDIISDILNGNTQTPGLLSIFGPDINVASNTPDGQWVNLLALSKLDMEQFGLGIYSSFDPDQAIGVALDSICQLNGISRRGGTYTQVQIVITTSQSVILNGLNNPLSPIFTVQDMNGNQYQLLTTSTIGAGTNTLLFQAENSGLVQTVLNTITTIVTPQLGVLLVNNPYAAIAIGASQETDAQLRLRRQQSTAGISTRKAMAMYAALSALPGVEQAVVYENVTATTNSTGVQPHSIWPIVVGGTTVQIANVVYYYLGDGCGDQGATSYSIQQIDGSQFTVYFDYAVQVPLYIHLNVKSLNNSYIDNAALASWIANNYILGINQIADITTLTALIKAEYVNYLVTSASVSRDNINFYSMIAPGAVTDYFGISSANITVTNT